jgi:hypothetical protein
MDAGERVVELIYEFLKIDEEWTQRHTNGFTWWAHRQAQHVTYEPAINDFGTMISRVRIETEVLRALPEFSLDELEAVGQYAPALCTPLLTDGSLRWGTSFFIHEQTVPHYSLIGAVAGAIQIFNAQFLGGILLSVIGGELAESGHPSNGTRPEADAMMRTAPEVIAQDERGASRFAGPAFAAIESSFGRQFSLDCNADEDGLTAEFPFGDHSSLLQMSVTDGDPFLGAGLRIGLTIPTNVGAADEFARELNRREWHELTRAPVIGMWRARQDMTGAVRYEAFVPNSAWRSDMASILFQHFAARSRWVLESVMGGNYDESLSTARSAVAQLFGFEPAKREADPPAKREPTKRRLFGFGRRKE